MTVAATLNFGINFNDSGLDKDIMLQILSKDASRPRGYHHVTKSRNRKLMRMTSSNERQRHKCIDLSNYNIFEPN